MALTRSRNFQSQQSAALPVVGTAALAKTDDIMVALDKHLDIPVRMYAAATPDSKLYFGSNKTEAGDGAAKVAPPVDDTIVVTVPGWIDFQAVTTSGPTFTREGAAFSFPTLVNGQFYRIAFVLKGSGAIDLKFSASAASVGALENPGILFSALDGLPIGYIDLEATSTTQLKTAGSATDIIENKVGSDSRIFRFGAGGGAGGGSDRTYKITAFSTTGCSVKGGYAGIDDSRVLSSGSGNTKLTAAQDVTVNLNTVLTASGLSFTADTIYTLVLDLTTIGVAIALDNKRSVHTWTEANLKLLSAHPDNVDPRRYVWLDQIYTPVAATDWSNAEAIVKPGRVHDTLASFFPYTEKYETTLNTAVASTALNHLLTGEPQVIQMFYFDGTNKSGLDINAHLLNKNSTQVVVSTLGLTFGGSEYVEIKAFYVPTIPNVASLSRTFTSVWYSNTATTTVAHGLTDMEDIRGYEVQEWDTGTGRRRKMDASALVVNFDQNNFYLNWAGLTPSASLLYRLVAGGSPLPWSIPLGSDNITNRAGTGAPNFPFGATGISAQITDFTLSAISDPNGTVKGGYLRLDDGTELGTYDGSGNTSGDFGGDLTVNLTTALGGSPSANTNYYLYADRTQLGAAIVQSDKGRRVVPVIATGFKVFTQTPDQVSPSRYIAISSIRTGGTANWVAAQFASVATKGVESGPLAISPVVETIASRSIGEVGAVANAQGALVDGDITFASSAYFPLNGDANNSASQGGNLTLAGSPSFNGVGFFGRENVVYMPSTINVGFSSTNAFFNVTTGSMSMGSWVNFDNWEADGLTHPLFTKYVTVGNQRQYTLYKEITGGFVFAVSSNGTGATSITTGNLIGLKGWHHVAAVFDNTGNSIKLYMDGKLHSAAAFASDLFSSTAVFKVGGAEGTGFGGRMQDAFFTSVALTDTQVNAIYSKRFTNHAQIAGGHPLTADSFPFASLSGKASFYNLDATKVDGSVNGFDLVTASGADSFAGVGLYGNDAAALFGGSNHMRYVSALFDFNTNTATCLFGGWLKVNSQPGASQIPFKVGRSAGGDPLFIVFGGTAGQIRFENSNANSIAFNGVYTPGQWVHVVLKLKNNTIHGYINGVLVGSVAQTQVSAPASGAEFAVGAFNTAQNYFVGSIREAFWTLQDLSDADIRKLASARIDLTNTSTAVANQKWEAFFESEDGKTINEFDTGWIVDKRKDKIYIDMGAPAGSKVTLRLSDMGVAARAIPVRSFDQTFTAAPAATIAHALAEMPTSIAVLHDELADGKWASLAASNHVKSDGTNLYLAGFGSLLIDSTHKLRIIASVAPAAVVSSKFGFDNLTPDCVQISTAGYQTSKGDHVLLQTGASAPVLPLNPVIGTRVVFIDGGIGLTANNVVVNRNFQLINSAASDFTLDVSNSRSEFVFVGGARGWQVF